MELQRPAGSKLWIELTDGTGCKISRVGKGRFTGLCLRLVELFKSIFIHHDFAANFRAASGKFFVTFAAAKTQRDGFNSTDIGRYVLAHKAVAPAYTLC